jgi:hypothetical protein
MHRGDSKQVRRPDVRFEQVSDRKIHAVSCDFENSP